MNGYITTTKDELRVAVQLPAGTPIDVAYHRFKGDGDTCEQCGKPRSETLADCCKSTRLLDKPAVVDVVIANSELYALACSAARSKGGRAQRGIGRAKVVKRA